MDTILKDWFTTSQQGVAFVEPVRNSQLEITDFRYKLTNKAFATLLRQTKEELSGQPISTFPPVLKDGFLPRLIAVYRTGHPQQIYEEDLRTDESVWLHINLARMDDQMLVTIQDVSEQKKAEHKLQRRLEMESIVSSVSVRLITIDAVDLDAYLIEALALVSTNNGADRASIFIYSADRQRGSCTHEWCADGIPARKESLQDVAVYGFPSLHDQLKNGQTIHLEADELHPEATEEQAILDLQGIRSLMAFPLIQDEKTIGFMAFYAIGQSSRWKENDVSLLKTFSTLIGNVQKRLQQEGALRRANQRLEGLRTIDLTLLSPRLADQSTLLMALRHINAMVPCERLTVFRIDEAAGLAIAECRLAEGVLEANPGVVFSSRYLSDRLLPNGEAGYVPDLQAQTADIPPELNLFGRGFRSMVVIPLYNRQVCIGAFTLLSITPYFFTDEYLQIAQEVARQLALVLYQQQLDEQQRHYTEQLEQRVAERTREITQLSAWQKTILEHAGQAILSTDIYGVIQTANQACEKLLDYRVDELIGRVNRVSPGTGENPIPLISYHKPDSVERPSNEFKVALNSQGYYHSECIAVGKNGRKVPILLGSSTLQDESGNLIGYVGIATDISALKTAEAELVRKNQELNTFFDGALDMHCISDNQGKLSKINRAFQTALGYSETELMAIPFLHLLHADEQPFVFQNLLSGILRKPVRNQINRFRKKDGTYRIVEWNAVGIDNLVYGSARDITESQQARIQSQSLNQRFQLATQAAGQGIWEEDLETGSLIWDDRLWEIHGLKPGRTDWTFSEFMKMVHPEDRPTFIKGSHQVTRPDSEQDKFTYVCRIIKPDGTIAYVETHGLVVRNQHGQPIRVIGVGWDVTERKLGEAALRESELRFREIAENVDEVFWIHSVEPFELLYINSAYERVFGIEPPRSTDGNSFMDTILAEDLTMVMAEFEKYRQGQEVTVQFRVKGTHKEIRWLHIRTFIMRDNEGIPVRYIGIVNDISSQKETELVLKQSLQREQELNQLKSQFVSTASHEFRTPLTTIQSSVDLVKLYLDLPPTTALPSIRKHLSIIEKEIEKFGGLMADMLTIGKIDAGKISFKPRLVDIVAVCEDIITTHFCRRYDHRTVQVMVEGIPYNAYLDGKLIQHVIVNLLSNAFKFSSEDPCLHILFKEDSLVLQVIDRGIGIPAADLSALFQAFFRARNTSGIQGTGLGLVIARQFVELHSGHLDVWSEENVGTTFTITLPVKQSDQAISTTTL